MHTESQPDALHLLKRVQAITALDCRVIFPFMRGPGRAVILLVPILARLFISASLAYGQAGVVLSGNVTDDSGGAVSGALVHLYSAKGVREIRANFDGVFQFAQVIPGKYELDVTFPGFKQATQDIEVSEKSPGPIALRLHVGDGGHCTVRGLREGERFFSPGSDNTYVMRVDNVDVRGLVRDDLGAPLAGVAVKLMGGGPIHATVTSGKGEFEFSGVKPGKYILTSSQDGSWDISRYLWITQENLTKVTVTLPDKYRVPCFEGFGPI